MQPSSHSPPQLANDTPDDAITAAIVLFFRRDLARASWMLHQHIPDRYGWCAHQGAVEQYRWPCFLYRCASDAMVAGPHRMRSLRCPRSSITPMKVVR